MGVLVIWDEYVQSIFTTFSFIFSDKKRKKDTLTVHDKLKNLITLLGITNPKVIDVTKKTGKPKIILF